MTQGNYFSLFYEKQEDLIDIVAAFFDAGLRKNECCLWGISGQLDTDHVKDLLKGAGLDVDRYLENGQLVLSSCNECYIAGNGAVSEMDLKKWEEIYNNAISGGYSGVRVVDKFTIVGEDAWERFVEYETKAMDLIKTKGIVGLFAFLLEARSRSQILEIIGMHDGTIVEQDGKWTLLQSSSSCKTIRKETHFPENMLENVWTGVWAVDKNDNLVYFNKGMESISGMSKTDVIGKKLVNFLPHGSDQGEMGFLDVFRTVKENLNSRSYDIFPFVKPDGQFIYHSGFLLPLTDEEGRYGGMIGTIGKLVEQRIDQATLRDKFRSMEKLEDIYRTSPVVAFLWKAEYYWPVAFVSENVSQFGYSPGDLTTGDIKYGDLIHPEDLVNVQNDISQLEIQGRMFFSREYRIVTKAGDIRWVIERSYLIRNEKGNPAYYQGIIIDISDRKKAEEAALEAEKKYHLIFENSPLGLFHFNEEGVVTHCNDNFLRIIGLEKKEDIIGFNMVDMIKDKKMKQAIDDVLSRKEGHFEGRYHTVVSGKDIFIKADYSPNIADDGTFLGGIGIFGDISVRKKAEEALRLDESRLEALLKITQLTDISLRGIADFVQEEAVRLTQSKMGYLAFLNDEGTILTVYSWSKNMMEDCKVKDMKLEYPIESTGLWGEPIRQKRAIIINDFEAPNKLKRGYPEGHIKLTRYMSIPIFDGRRVVGAAGVANKQAEYDKSDARQLTLFMEGMWRLIQRKRAEDTLREYADELSRVNIELSKANEELSEANEELKSLDRMKDEFLSNVSHEFKTPLTSIQGYSQLIGDETLGKVNGQQKKAVDTIVRNSERLRRLVDSLLYLSRAQSGKLRYSFDMIDLADVIENAIQDLALQAEGKGVELIKDVPDDLPLINADRDKMMDVFVNLIDNAIKFTPQDGKVVVSASVSQDSIYAKVEDTGIGIPGDKIGNLFERFYQVDSSGKRKYGGTGLGLYICKKIVEDHNGDIHISSEEGKGTTVYMDLPLQH